MLSYLRMRQYADGQKEFQMSLKEKIYEIWEAREGIRADIFFWDDVENDFNATRGGGQNLYSIKAILETEKTLKENMAEALTSDVPYIRTYAGLLIKEMEDES